MRVTLDQARAYLAALAVALCACQGSPARSKPWRHQPGDGSGEITAEPVSSVLKAEKVRVEAHKNRAHTLRIHMDARPLHLNPMVTPTEWGRRIVMDTVFETLIRYVPPEGGSGAGPGRYEGGLAKSWTKSPDGREIRFEIHPGIRFHNGHRLSSVDVQFALDAARLPRNRAHHLWPDLKDVSAVEIVSSRVIRVRLARPNGYVMRALANVPIMPSEVYFKKLRAVKGPVVGSGPYKLAHWDDNGVQLTTNEKYWGKKPAIRDVVFVYEKDAAAALTAAKRGEIDIVPGLVPAHYPEQTEAPGIVRDFAPLLLSPPAYSYLVVNVRREPFADRRFRQALAQLIDRGEIARRAFGGLARPVPGPVWPGGPGDGATAAPVGFDVRVATDLLDRIGYRRDGSGVRRRGSERLALDVLVGDAESVLRDRVLAGFRKHGIATDTREGPPAVLMNRLAEGDFGMAFLESRGSVDRNLESYFASGGKRNYGGHSHRGIDSVLSSLRLAQDPAARAPLMAELAKHVGRELPIIPLLAKAPYGLAHKRVSGLLVWDGWFYIRDLSFVSSADGD
jgi:peptide/nickel transport system substrate-binding protein